MLLKQKRLYFCSSLISCLEGKRRRMGIRRGVPCKEINRSIKYRKLRKEERDHIEMIMKKMKMKIMAEIREERLLLLKNLLLLKQFVLLNLLK